MPTDNDDQAAPPQPDRQSEHVPLKRIPMPLLLLSGFVTSVAIAAIMSSFIVKARIDAVAFDLGESIPLEGVLARNNRLTRAEILLNNKVFGPESIAVDEENGLVYTGLKSGLIIEIDMELRPPRILRAVELTSHKDCDGSYRTAPKCGRPLGIRQNAHGEILVADAYLGLFVIDFKTELSRKILGAGELPINDKNAPPLRYINDFDFLPDGRLILSESSTKFDDRDMMLDMFEHRPNGRLLIYDPKTMNLFVLKDGLYFPNGVQVAIEKGAAKDDDVRVFFSEMGMARVMTIWVPRDSYSKKVLRTKVLIDHLPGYPDNIRLTKKGELLVPLPAYRTENDRYFEQSPRIREYFTKVFSSNAFAWLGTTGGTQRGMVIKVNTETGQIIDSYQDYTGKVNGITIAVDDGKGRLLLGNDDNYYIARVKI